jgi:hypothetical protein
VVVNYRSKVDAKGKPVTEALSAKELAQIENLTKEAMGFSADRGDSLNVVNSPFTPTQDGTGTAAVEAAADDRPGQDRRRLPAAGPAGRVPVVQGGASGAAQVPRRRCPP